MHATRSIGWEQQGIASTNPTPAHCSNSKAQSPSAHAWLGLGTAAGKPAGPGAARPRTVARGCSTIANAPTGCNPGCSLGVAAAMGTAVGGGLGALAGAMGVEGGYGEGVATGAEGGGAGVLAGEVTAGTMATGAGLGGTEAPAGIATAWGFVGPGAGPDVAGRGTPVGVLAACWGVAALAFRSAGGASQVSMIPSQPWMLMAMSMSAVEMQRAEKAFMSTHASPKPQQYSE
jgi:hypothetical protein